MGNSENYSEWFRSTEDPRAGLVLLDKGVPGGLLKPVEYSAINGRALFEGDIVLSTVKDMQALVSGLDIPIEEIPVSGKPARDILTTPDTPRPASIAITGNVYRWPKGIVPYEIDSGLPAPERVTHAVEHWMAKTPFKFVKRDPNNQDHANYISFESHDGCWSQVGMQGGKQIISLILECGLGSAIHEIGHAIGLWHEQSREDRTKYIRIAWENITPGREHNFNQHIVDGDDLGAYDYDSIMHYPPRAFSKNGKPTITALKEGGANIGQRDGLSEGDIAGVRLMYPDLKWS